MRIGARRHEFRPFMDEDLRADAWRAWRDDLIMDGRSLDDAEDWLDMVFVQQVSGQNGVQLS
ncbi:hypothetical protein [Deinococcus sedimenti]|nr:hypothetical protein [Deinococcus sedimenti]